MSRQSLIFLAALGSFLLLAAAFLFQALGWAPCTMCLWQRWPHGAAIALGVVGLFVPSAAIAGLGALAAAATAGLGLFHSGVEQDWWEGPAACSAGAGDLSGMTGDMLLPGAQLDAPALVLCDAFTPFLLGLSMANWNALASLALMVVWIMAALHKTRTA